MKIEIPLKNRPMKFDVAGILINHFIRRDVLKHFETFQELTYEDMKEIVFSALHETEKLL